MKKVLSLLLVFALLIPFAACAKKEEPSAATAREEATTVAETDAPAVTTLSPEEEEEAWQKENARLYAARFNGIADPDVRAAVEDFYGECYNPTKLLRWWAGLYDPERGAFYYAISARDGAGYLPDMESTYQIVDKLLQFDRDGDLARYLGPEITEKMIAFYQTMQDESDGYFYHPQWTKEQSRKNVMRYTRDQDWAIFVLDKLHSAPLYPTALERLNGDGASVSTDWGPNEESVKAYVRNLIATNSCENWANELSTQATTFEAAGVLGYIIDVLDETINPEYGLWASDYDGEYNYKNLRTEPVTENAYGIMTCTYKLMVLYNLAGRAVPYPVKMAESAAHVIELYDISTRVTYVYNPWATLGTLRINLDGFGTPEQVAGYDAVIGEHMIGMLSALKTALAKYRQSDGGYGFLKTGSASSVYGTKVSQGKEEGDVNATNMVYLLSEHVSRVLGLSSPIPIFNVSHGRQLRQLLDNAPKIVKK